MSDILVVGDNVLAGQLVVVTLQSNGTVRAVFPRWPGEDLNPMYVEVSTLSLLLPLVLTMLAFHP